MALDLFSPRLHRTEHTARVKGWVRAALSLGEDVTVMVTELSCTEEGCPPLETVIAILAEGSPPRQHKVHRARAELTERDVVEALGEHHAN